jgi:hypothetical protein
MPEWNFPRPMIRRFFRLVFSLFAARMSDCITSLRVVRVGLVERMPVTNPGAKKSQLIGLCLSFVS